MFMKPEIIFETFVAIDTDNGTTLVPADVIGEKLTEKIQSGKRLVWKDKEELLQYCDGFKFEQAIIKEGYFFRLSASGFLDCTEWNGPYSTLYECVWDMLMNYFDESEQEDWKEFLDDCSAELTTEELNKLFEGFFSPEL